MSEQHIPIFCATDESYAPFTSLMMKSVLMHTKSFIDFYIMDGGIKKKTKKLIAKDLKKYPNKDLHFVDMGKYNLTQFPDINYFSTNMYSRYFIPQITPHVEKAIYLDVDIIVAKDITELYNQDMEGHPIAAMEETKWLAPIESGAYLKMMGVHSDRYFNSGVLLFNIQKLIQMDFTNKATQLTNTFRYSLHYPDQDILNILFEDNYKSLDVSFNFMAAYLHIFKEQFPSLKIDPVIIHYAVLKPWKESTPFQQQFNEVLDTSVFKKDIIKKYRSKKISKYYLFGHIPLFETVKLK